MRGDESGVDGWRKARREGARSLVAMMGGRREGVSE